jgi:hypothetical protein
MDEAGRQEPIKGLTVIEIIGRDVLTWRLVQDARPSHVAVVDSPQMQGLHLADEVGEITDYTCDTAHHTPRTVVSFEARSPTYSMIYWRPGYITEHDGRLHFEDAWHAVERRVFLWAFPPHTVFEHLEPPALHSTLGAWGGQPLAAVLATRITAAAIYRHDRATPPLRPIPPPTLAALLARLPTSPGLPHLLATVRAQCAAHDLLRGSRLLAHLLAS